MLRNLAANLFVLFGAWFITAGAWLLHPSIGLIVAGILTTAVGIGIARTKGTTE